MTGRESLLLGGALAVLAMGLGVLLGWYAAFDPSTAPPMSSGYPLGADGGAAPSSSSLQVEVHSVLVLPSPTPTTTPRPATATAYPTRDPIPPCATATPGALCRVPPPTPPPPTPYPACDVAMATPFGAGGICRWR